MIPGVRVSQSQIAKQLIGRLSILAQRAVNYAPQNLVADGNLYDAAAEFRWNEPKHWISMSFADWRAATGQDRRACRIERAAE